MLQPFVQESPDIEIDLRLADRFYARIRSESNWGTTTMSLARGDAVYKGFISYAHEDEPMCLELRKQLKALEVEGIASFWADRAIEPGNPWKDEIITQLQTADVALFLVSPAMIWSEFIWSTEWPIAQDRASKNQMIIIPVILRPCLYQALKKNGLAGIQSVPKDGRPILDFNPIDFGYFDAAERISNRLTPRAT